MDSFNLNRLNFATKFQQYILIVSFFFEWIYSSRGLGPIMDSIYLHRDASTSKVPVAYPTLQDRAMRPVKRTSSAYCVKIGQMND